MATSSKKHGFKTFIITLISLLVIGAAFLASITRSLVSEISVRQVGNDNVYPSIINKIAVPFGSNEGLLFPVVPEADGNATKSGHRARASGVRKREDKHMSWEEAMIEGERFLGILHGPRKQSPVEYSNQIIDSGWSLLPGTDEISNEYTEPGGPFAAYRINIGNGLTISAEQDNEFKNRCQDQNAATGAVFREIYIVQSRTIVGDFNYGPLWRLTQEQRAAQDAAQGLGPAENRLPEIRRWSDITWAIWAGLARVVAPNNDPDPGVQDLKYIFKHDIRTTSTKDIMEMAGHPPDDGESSDGSDIDETFANDWPGVTYRPGEDKFQALLGTPHGKGIVWILVDHPNELGGKTIESITMFTAGPDGNYNLLFTLTG